MSRRVAAKPQTAQRDHTSEQRGERDDEPARVVTGHVVIARVRDQIVGNDVNRSVGHHSRGGGSGDHQRDERARDDGHRCLRSGPLLPPPRGGRLKRRARTTTDASGPLNPGRPCS